MPQCLTYKLGGGLYVNMTNRCTCACDFCERNTMDSVGDAESLWLDHEPTREEIWESIRAHNLKDFDELVFCGFGEPMLRAGDLLWVARQVKEKAPEMPIRVNTNGHANMIAGRDMTPDMAGLIDRLSISLNRADEAAYNLHMRPVFGMAAFHGVLDFARKAREHVPDITFTAVDLISPDELSRCRAIAGELGLAFRARAAH